MEKEEGGGKRRKEVRGKKRQRDRDRQKEKKPACLGESVSSAQIAQIEPILEKLGNQEGTLHLEHYSEMNQTITFEAGPVMQEPPADTQEAGTE